MKTAVIEMIPEGQFSIKDLDILIFALEGRVKAQEVMHRKDAAKFLGMSVRNLDALSSNKRIPFHKPEGWPKMYLRSEILDFIKRS